MTLVHQMETRATPEDAREATATKKSNALAMHASSANPSVQAHGPCVNSAANVIWSVLGTDLLDRRQCCKSGVHVCGATKGRPNALESDLCADFVETGISNASGMSLMAQLGECFVVLVVIIRITIANTT